MPNTTPFNPKEITLDEVRDEYAYYEHNDDPCFDDERERFQNIIRRYESELQSPREQLAGRWINVEGKPAPVIIDGIEVLCLSPNHRYYVGMVSEGAWYEYTGRTDHDAQFEKSDVWPIAYTAAYTALPATPPDAA